MKKLLFLSVLLFVAFPGFAQWQFAGGVPKATINTLYNFEGTLLAGTSGGLLYYDKNQHQWQEINDNQLLKNIVNIKTDNNRLYTVSDHTYASISLGTSLLFTNNFGNNWDTIYLNYNDPIQFYTVHQDSLLLGSLSKMMFFSADNGVNWTPRNFIDTDFSSLKYTAQGVFGFTQPGRILWFTTDWGLNWQEVPLPQPTAGYIPLKHKNRVLIQQLDRMYVLNDDFTWTLIDIPPGDNYFELLYADDKVFLGYQDYDYYWSYNKGASWEKKNGGDLYHNYEFIGEILYTSSFTEIFSSENEGGNFLPMVAGLEVAGSFTSLAAGTGTLLVSSQGSCHQSEDGGTSWNKVDAFNESVLLSDGNSHFYSLAYSTDAPTRNIWYSHDTGKIWNKISVTSEDPGALTRNGNFLFSAGGARIYKYEFKNNIYTESIIQTGHNPYTIAELKGKDSIIIAIDILGKVIISKDLGATWNEITYDLHRFSNGSSSHLNAFILKEGVFIINKTTHHIFKLDEINGGWVELKNKFSPDPINFLENIGNQILIGVRGNGLFLSQDGENWQNVNDNITKFNPLSIATDEQNVYIGMGGGGLWKRPLADFNQVLAINEPKNSAKLLLTLYPNPATTQFSIDWSNIPGTGEAFALTLYDLTGKAIFTRQISNGINHNGIDVSNLPKGVYIVMIKNQQGSFTERIVIQ